MGSNMVLMGHNVSGEVHLFDQLIPEDSDNKARVVSTMYDRKTSRGETLVIDLIKKNVRELEECKRTEHSSLADSIAYHNKMVVEYEKERMG